MYGLEGDYERAGGRKGRKLARSRPRGSPHRFPVRSCIVGFRRLLETAPRGNGALGTGLRGSKRKSIVLTISVRF